MNGALGQLDWGLWVVRSSPLLEKKPFKFAAFIFPGQLGMVRSSSQPDVMVSTPWTSCTLKKYRCPILSPEVSVLGISAFTKLQGIPMRIRLVAPQ